MIARIMFSIVLACALHSMNVQAAGYPSVEVADAFIDLRTGPGRGYPKTQIVERGEYIEVMIRKTDWLKVRTDRGIEGWVHREDMIRTLSLNGKPFVIDTVGEGEFAHRRWEVGFKVGTYDNARTSDAYLGYYFTDNLSIEGTAGEAYSRGVDFIFMNISLTHQPWPHWRYSPYVTLGGGTKFTQYSSSEIQLSDESDQTLHAGVGLRIYLTRQLMLRGEYRSNVILTNEDQNDESDEWTIGLSAFF